VKSRGIFRPIAQWPGPPPPVTHDPPNRVPICGPFEGSLISTTVPTALGEAATSATLMSSPAAVNVASSELCAAKGSVTVAMM
jgi:hypothetical protein